MLSIDVQLVCCLQCKKYSQIFIRAKHLMRRDPAPIAKQNSSGGEALETGNIRQVKTELNSLLLCLCVSEWVGNLVHEVT